MGLAIENQTGKRNLTDVQRTFQIGELYKLKKKKHGGDRRSDDFSSVHSEHLKKDTTREEVALEQNVSKATVERAAKFHTAVTDIADVTGQWKRGLTTPGNPPPLVHKL